MKSNEKKSMGKREFVLVAVILLAALALFLYNQSRHQSPAAVVEISIDGTVIETLDLNKDQEYTIESTTGGTNHLIVKDRQVWVSKASCPDKVCIHQGKISRDGELIVCLPNRMIAKISGETP